MGKGGHMYRILIVEDDIALRQLIKESLELCHYDVYITNEFENINQVFEQINPHITLLDINLPYLDGFIICKLLRKKSISPIVIISARNSEDEQIFGIELGADEYLVKPFSMDMLKAKIKAIIRRTYEIEDKKGSDNNQLITCKELILNTYKFEMSYKNNSIELSKNEFILLKFFLGATNKIIKREKLMLVLWDDNSFIDENTLNVNIKRLKDRLLDIGIKNVIKTKRGIGYYFDTEEIKK